MDQPFETVALRRIALLVIRAREETSGAVSDRLFKISSVIENMKRSIALGSPLAVEDVARLQALVKQLPKRSSTPRTASEIVRWSTFSELRDLVTRV